MPNYIKRPEPGRFSRKETIIERVVERPKEEKEPESMDINALANAIAKVINITIPQTIVNGTGEMGAVNDSFDNSKTMKRLATQMLVQRGDNKANFDNLGNVQKTKKDQKDVDNTIDLLSKLDN